MENRKYTQRTIQNAFAKLFYEYETRVEMIDECANSNLNRFWYQDKFLKFWGLYDYQAKNYHEEKHGNAKFLLTDFLKVELAENLKLQDIATHKYKVKNTGVNILTDFFLIKPSHTLDLTWMKPKDVFRLKDSVQYGNLKNILVNVDNLVGSTLYEYLTTYENNLDFSLHLLINAKHSKLTPEQQVKAVHDFFEQQRMNLNTYHVDDVTLDDFSPVAANAIGSYLNEKGIQISLRKQLNIDTDSKVLKNRKNKEVGIMLEF